MVDIRSFARQDPSNAAVGSGIAAWFDTAGAMGVTSEADLLARAGYGFHVTVGAFSTPIVGGGNGTVLDQDQPEFVLDIPSGTAVRPIRISVQCQAPLIAADNDESEILIAVDRTQSIGATSSHGTAETIFNMRTDNPIASNCTSVSACTSNTTNPTLGIELARKVVVGDVQGTAANAMFTAIDLVYEPATPPVIVGPATLLVYWGGTVATSGFAQVEWVEYQPAFNGLFN